MPRKRTSPWTYDRAAIRRALETDGYDATMKRWPPDVVRPIARALGLTKPYNRSRSALTPEQIGQLGSRSDYTLSGEWGISLSTVQQQRWLLGIPNSARGKDAAIRERLRQITDAQLAGSLFALARTVGMRSQLLAAERRRRGIRLSKTGAGAPSVVPPVTECRRVAIVALRKRFPAITLRELGEVFGLTRERVRQLEQEMRTEGIAS